MPALAAGLLATTVSTARPSSSGTFCCARNLARKPSSGSAQATPSQYFTGSGPGGAKVKNLGPIVMGMALSAFVSCVPPSMPLTPPGS